MKKDSQENNQHKLNREARTAAQTALEGLAVNPTGRVEYSSEGRIAIIGNSIAQEFASRLSGFLKPLVILTDGSDEPGVPTVALGGRSIRVNGYMGAFSIDLGEQGKPSFENIRVDLVLDLLPSPLLTMPIKPPGYFTSGLDEPELSLMENQLLEMLGTFEKPRFFDYDASICAHGRSGQQGCNRCIETCPAEAITSLVESIEVNPYLCQGGGICATVCPSGAIRYNYPDVASMMNQVRTLLKTYTEHGGQQAVIGFVAESDVPVLDQVPDNLLIIAIEELASVGMDTWLSALAYGASKVLLINGGSVPDSVAEALSEQLAISASICRGLGYSDKAIEQVTAQDLSSNCQPAMPGIEVARFAGIDEKRTAMFMALDHLVEQSSCSESLISLPGGAPFGSISVDPASCTLCMSCTSVCPASAVQAGNELPQLAFYESKCLQCGICKAACPEQAISLETRLLTDSAHRKQKRVLHEEPPFCCISCGKPFATRSVIQGIFSRLEGHEMFRDERAKRRLQMCDDCRVSDMVQDEQAMQQVLGTRHH